MRLLTGRLTPPTQPEQGSIALALERLTFEYRLQMWRRYVGFIRALFQVPYEIPDTGPVAQW